MHRGGGWHQNGEGEEGSLRMVSKDEKGGCFLGEVGKGFGSLSVGGKERKGHYR